MRHMLKRMIRNGGGAFTAAVLALQALAGGDALSIPGWSSDFHASTNLAIQAHVPLVMIWGNRGCEHCQRLEADVQEAGFADWRAASGYQFCFVLGSLGKDPANAKGARTFSGTAGGTMASPRSYPFVCVYWRRPDGTLSARSFTTESADTVRAAAEDCFAGYVSVRDPDEFFFGVSNTAYDRLEAEPGTPYVDVPLARKINRGGIATNRLVSIWPEALLPPATNLVIWSGAETQKLVRVDLSRGSAVYPEGKQLELVLDDASGQIQTGAVHFVSAQASSVHNPKFVGEEFDFGEWTMDYEAAKRKGGYLLANFSGGLWCPDCDGIDNTLLADPRFTAWAVSNRVSLVLFDQGRSSSPATAEGNGTARLLTYAAGPCYFRDGRPLVSGASYLSRKAISPDAAAARIEMTTRFTQEWRPAGSSAARLGNPTFLFVKDDKVSGRVDLKVDGYVYDPEENIRRLSDMLRQIDEGGTDPSETTPPPVEIVNPYRGKKRQKQTIPLVAQVNGDSRLLTGTLAVSIASKDKITAKYVGAGSKTYSFSGIWQKQDAATGMLSATLTKKEATLVLSLATNGTLMSTLTLPGRATYWGGTETIKMEGKIGLARTGAFAPYAGCYTVQMPTLGSKPEGCATGGISLSLKMTTASAIKAGRMTYSVVLHNGKTVSGNAVLDIGNDEAGVECACLPIFVRSSQRVFGALLQIAPNGAATWSAPIRAEELNVVGAADKTVAYCLMREKITVLTTHEIFGSWFATGSTPKTLCQRFSLGDAFCASVVADGFARSERYGDVVTLPSATVGISGKKFVTRAAVGGMKLSAYAVKTGIVKGRGKIRFSGHVVEGQFVGIVMPGWIDCQCVEGFVERPFASGAFWFTDYMKVSGRWRSVVRSMPFELAVEQD